MSDLDNVIKALDKIEANLTKYSERADSETKELGKVSSETKAALDAFGINQREMADRLV